MKSFLALAVAGLASLASAQPMFTNSQINPVPGSPFTLTWSNAQGAVTVKLKNGPSGALKDVLTVCSGVTGSSCTWNVPTNLPTDTYAFEIDDASGDPNYSLQFSYVGTGTASSSGTASVTQSASSTSSASHSSTSSASKSSSSATSTTSTSASTSASKTSSSTTAATTTSVPGAANQLSSPLALILVTVAAMFYFH